MITTCYAFRNYCTIGEKKNKANFHLILLFFIVFMLQYIVIVSKNCTKIKQHSVRIMQK